MKENPDVDVFLPIVKDINVEGKFFPCSFLEDEDFEGIDCTEKDLDFFKKVWQNEKVVEVRNKIINAKTCNRSCYKYKLS